MNTQSIRQLVANDEIEQALQSLVVLTESTSHYNSGNLLQNRYTRWKAEKIKGIEDAKENTRIADAVLALCSEIEAANGSTVPTSASLKRDISHLPILHPYFVGRQPELALLDQCWQNPQTNLIEFVAPGGTGKTTLVTYWLLNRLPLLDTQPEAVFAFSFYSQGTSDQRQSSSDPFFSRANAFFGVENPPTDPRERARTLVTAIRARRAVLILDGIEPLQYPPGPLGGQIKDPSLRHLLKELATAQPGLCICTTRVPMEELMGMATPQHHARMLENLDEAAGVDLLQQIGVRGLEGDFRAALAAYKGHALALRLLGNYIIAHWPHEPDIRKRDQIERLFKERKQGLHANHVMEAYEAWIADHHTGTGIAPEIALLRMLGLFDRPASVEALNALLAPPDITGLTEGLRDCDEETLRYALNNLTTLGLLTEIPLATGALPKNTPNLPALRHTAAIDAHPLVREYFGERLEKNNPDAWREANLRLFEYYRNLPEKHLPDTEEEMEPLFMAMAFGCRAGEQEKVRREVYWERIKRENENYSINQLGAFGSDLTALAHLFERVWSRPSRNMSEAGQALVLSLAGFRLRGLGRLLEAVEPMKAGMEMSVKQNDWKGAAADAANLSELHLSIGQVSEAVRYGRQAGEFADQSGDWGEKIVQKTTLADALHQAGKTEEAATWFEAAEALQQESQPEYRFLYSLQGYQYCDLLLGLGRWAVALERVERFLEWRQDGDSLLSIALENLSAGRAQAQAFAEHPIPEHQQAATQYLNLAVEGLRKAGAMEFIAKGLLARAAWHRQNDHYGAAQTDLQEVLEIAEFGHMGLFLVDYHLEMGRLARAQGQHAVAEQHQAEALERVRKTGYLRRLGEVEAV